MSLEGLDQALFEAKWGDAEADVIEVIARALELSPSAVERVLYAAAAVKDSVRWEKHLREHMFDGLSLPEDLQIAIKSAMEMGMRRAAVRSAIQNDKPLLVKMAKLAKLGARICDGCKLSIRCALEDISTPPKCTKSGPPVSYKEPNERWPGQLMHISHAGKGGVASVRVVKLKDNNVFITCEHPRGEWTVDIEDFEL